VTIKLTWDFVNGAAVYEVQVSTDSTFENNVFVDSTQPEPNITIAGLSNNTTYSWRVKAKNSSESSSWTSPWKFTTILGVPVLKAPANGARDQSLSDTLTWSRQNDAVTFHVQVSTDSSFAGIVFEDSTITVSQGVPVGLKRGTVYFWRVNAKNAGGVSSWSNSWSFSTADSLKAIAGSDTTVPQGTQAIMLRGDLSKGNIVKYEWAIDSGGCSSPSPVFCAVASGDTLMRLPQFFIRVVAILRVTDGAGNISTDSLTITSGVLKFLGQSNFTFFDLYCLWMVKDTEIYCLEANVMSRSTDGGVTWNSGPPNTVLYFDTQHFDWVDNLFFYKNAFIYSETEITYDRYTYFYISDDGNNWRFLDSFPYQELHPFIYNDTFYASNQLALVSTDTGFTWENIPTSINKDSLASKNSSPIIQGLLMNFKVGNHFWQIGTGQGCGTVCQSVDSITWQCQSFGDIVNQNRCAVLRLSNRTILLDCTSGKTRVYELHN
jgi:hypothetical protein